jgi:hypothetical protein
MFYLQVLLAKFVQASLDDKKRPRSERGPSFIQFGFPKAKP